MRKIIRILFASSLVILAAISMTVAEDNKNTVLFIPVEQEVERGLEAFLKRAIEKGEELNVDRIILEMDTPGGRVDAALNIGKLIRNSDIPVITYITNKAISAGSYIALNGDQIYMASGSTIGAAGVIDQAGNAADLKTQSMWINAMEGAAKTNGRDPIYAMAMADAEVDLPKYDAPKGKYLTLTAEEAIEVGYSEGIANNRVELLTLIGFEDAKIETLEPSIAEVIARFITHPVVVPILLSIGSLGLVLELYTPGFGIPGLMGLSSLLLFFYGHIVAGLAGFESLILLIVGIFLIILEFFLPGGIMGVLGVLSIIASLFLAGQSVGLMALSILIAILVTIGVSIIMFKFFGKRIEGGFLKRIILSDTMKTESGYVSNQTRLELMGLNGTTLTPLRPSGVAVFDTERLDVITEGGFIDKNKPVQIIKTEGSRVIVRELIEKD